MNDGYRFVYSRDTWVTAVAQQMAVTPLKGQASEQTQKDTAECQAAANSSSSATAQATAPPVQRAGGGRLRGRLHSRNEMSQGVAPAQKRWRWD